MELIHRLIDFLDSGKRSQLQLTLGRELLMAYSGDIEPSVSEPPGADCDQDWFDEQLYRLAPPDDYLDALDDYRFVTLRSAWPEGFDIVVFSESTEDEWHARHHLVEAYLESARKFELPLPTDFHASTEEMDQLLTEHFVRFIQEWRDRTLDWFESQEKDTLRSE